MEGSLQGFADFHGDKVNNMLEEYFKSMKITEDSSEKDTSDNEVEEFAKEIDKIIIDDNKNKNDIKSYDELKCMCRLSKKGIPSQCKGLRVNKTIYCTRHSKKIKEGEKLEFGLMNEDMPTHYPLGSKKEGERIKWSEDISKNNIEKEKPKKRKCSKCGEYGHNKKSCTKKEKIVVKKEKVVEEKVVEEKVVEEKVCIQCKKAPKDDNFTMVKDDIYCYICYKVFIEKCDDCNKRPCDCDTESMSDDDMQECKDLISEDTNEYIYFQGVHYYYDNETNIVAYDYEEVGIWNTKSETIDWYNTECEEAHKSNPDYNA